MSNSSSIPKPSSGTPIARRNGQLVVPDDPIIPFIEGDGTGPDIWRASVRVMDAAVEKAYGGRKKIAWLEVYAGEKSFKQSNSWLPDETVDAFREYFVGIKGPLTTPVGGGIRSLNVALRQELDLYVCLRPVRYFSGSRQIVATSWAVAQTASSSAATLPLPAGGPYRWVTVSVSGSMRVRM